MGGGASAAKRLQCQKALCKDAVRGGTSDSGIDMRMVETFRAWDVNGDGTIALEELREIINKLGIKLSDGEIAKLLKEADLNGDGRVDFQEFWIWLKCPTSCKEYFEVSGHILEQNKAEGAEFYSKYNAIRWDIVFQEGRAGLYMEKMSKDIDNWYERTQARISKKLTPIIKNLFAFHDKDGNGVLELDESIMFFSNYAMMLPQYLLPVAEFTIRYQRKFETSRVDFLQVDERGLDRVARACISAVRDENSEIEFLKLRLAEMQQDYLSNIDARHVAAFKVLDVNQDGKLQMDEVVEALLHGTHKNEEFMEALGLYIPPDLRALTLEIPKGPQEVAAAIQRLSGHVP
eukprot:TRINITY_DN76026_c0_g1_i1.p1 TRINITY_DN76026_c0_g1~~TRINITY_DN76026_c0_g1_i1.p1  ORF type:complete len:347 (-),score=79.92 TRINITY_DN76026_c0_g1_i1:174-1214(-)